MKKAELVTIGLPVASLPTTNIVGSETTEHQHGELFELLSADGYHLYDADGYELLAL